MAAGARQFACTHAIWLGRYSFFSARFFVYAVSSEQEAQGHGDRLLDDLP
jgi:hypothetical protein